MNNGKRHFSAQEKFEIVKEALISGASISEICRRSGMHSSQYYSWQRKFLEGALEKLKQKGRKKGDNERERLRELLERKNAVIAKITDENLD